MNQHVLIDETYKNRNLRGCMVSNVIFVNDSSNWKENEKQRFLATLHEVTTLLESEAAKEGVSLRFTVKSEEMTCNALPSGRPVGLEGDLARSHGFEIASQYTEYLKKTYMADDIQLIFVRREPIWEYAMPNPTGGAIFVSQSSTSISVLHEMLHLYGAKDLYLPVIKDLAEYCFPDSAMNSGFALGPHSIDPLSRFLLGWRKEPSPIAAFFLDQTSDLTLEQFEASRVVKSNKLEIIWKASAPFASIEQLQKAAYTKDPWASFLVGLCYAQGIYLPKDLQAAERFYKQSFAGSCAPAGFALAEMLLSKEVLTQNEKAEAHRILLTLQHNPYHMLAVSLYASCLFSGYSFSNRNLEQALSVVISNYNRCNSSVDLETEFSKLPETVQQHHLLAKLSTHLPKLHEVVMQIANQYAQSDGVLLYLMGKFLLDGTHLSTNPTRALELYLKAANLGLSAAANAVSYCYSNGVGTPVDPVAAQLWKERGLKEESDPTTRLAIHILNRALDDTYASY